MARLIVVALAVLGAGTIATGPAGAATNSEGIVIGMPFEGRWGWYALKAKGGSDKVDSHPSYHHRGNANWAIDLYGAAKTPVKFHHTGATGSTSFTATKTASCGGTGSTVKITIKVDGKAVGSVSYHHLDTAGIDLSTIKSGKVIGKLKKWPNAGASCWNVDNDQGVHTHFTATNQVNKSCWIDQEPNRVGGKVPYGGGLAILGSNNTGTAPKCVKDVSVGPWSHFIVQWTGDTKQQKTSWVVTAGLDRKWIPDIPTYQRCDTKFPGPVKLPGTVLDLLPDLTGQHAQCT